MYFLPFLMMRPLWEPSNINHDFVSTKIRKRGNTAKVNPAFLMNWPKLRTNSTLLEIIWMNFLQDSHFYTNFAG